MSNNDIELYKAFRTTQEKFTYFLLAADGAAIAFAITKTQDAKLAWSQAPLGIAVLCWGLSFVFGCQQLRYVASSTYANMDLLKVERGQHPEAGTHPGIIAAASEGIRSAIAKNSDRASWYGTWHFRLLVAGAVLYIVWHVFEMYLRSR